MGIMDSCAKCGAFVCACGFVATLVVSSFWDTKPPPSRVLGPIAAQFTGTIGTTILPTMPYLEVSDQITGKVYSAVWLDRQKQRELAYSTGRFPVLTDM
jgi:hypothetical protein